MIELFEDEAPSSNVTAGVATAETGRTPSRRKELEEVMDETPPEKKSAADEMKERIRQKAKDFVDVMNRKKGGKDELPKG